MPINGVSQNPFDRLRREAELSRMKCCPGREVGKGREGSLSRPVMCVMPGRESLMYGRRAYVFAAWRRLLYKRVFIPEIMMLLSYSAT